MRTVIAVALGALIWQPASASVLYRFVYGEPWYSATGYWLDPVPEPASWLLLVVGLLGLAGVRRRYV